MLDKSNVRFRGKALDDLYRVAELEAARQTCAVVSFTGCEICGSADPNIHFTEHFTRR